MEEELRDIALSCTTMTTAAAKISSRCRARRRQAREKGDQTIERGDQFARPRLHGPCSHNRARQHTHAHARCQQARRREGQRRTEDERHGSVVDRTGAEGLSIACDRDEKQKDDEVVLLHDHEHDLDEAKQSNRYEQRAQAKEKAKTD